MDEAGTQKVRSSAAGPPASGAGPRPARRPARRRSGGSACLAVAGLASIAACKVGPDYQAPSPEAQAPGLVSTASPDAASAGITSGVPALREWWLSLRDAKLSSLVDALVAQNLDLRTAEARVREARALRGVAASALSPQLYVSGLVGVAATNDKFHGGIQYGVGANAPNTGFTASWQLDVFGGLRRGVEAADAGLEAAVKDRRAVLVATLGELGTTYVQLRGEQRQLAIARRNVSFQERTLELEQTLKRSGLASELQVSQAATQLETTRAAIPGLEAAVAKSIFRLGVLIGREPGALADELATPGPIPDAPPTIPVGLPSELLVRRPDVRRVERLMAQATAEVGVARADLYPRFSLTANIQFSSPYGLPGQPSFFVGPNVNWPLFTGFRVSSQVDASDARLEQAILSYRATILNAFEEVEDTLTAYSKELIRRDTLARAAKQAERAAELAQTQYKNGLVDFLNVLTAQGTQAASELALAASEQALLTDLVAVYEALGGGWDVFEEKLAARDERPASTELPR